jgi:hypothetical protein
VAGGFPAQHTITPQISLFVAIGTVAVLLLRAASSMPPSHLTISVTNVPHIFCLPAAVPHVFLLAQGESVFLRVDESFSSIFDGRWPSSPSSLHPRCPAPRIRSHSVRGSNHASPLRARGAAFGAHANAFGGGEPASNRSAPNTDSLESFMSRR